MVQNNAGLLRDDRGDRYVYSKLRNQRERADYGDGHVAPHEIEEHRAWIRKFVEDLLR